MKNSLSNSCNTQGESGAMKSKAPVLAFKNFTKYFGVIALFFLVIFFAIKNPRFIAPANITNVLKQVSPMLLVGLGTTFIILMGSIDLSIDGTVTLAGIISVLVANRTATIPVVGGLIPVVVGIVVGMVIGFVNGSLMARLRLPSFLVTLGVSTVCSGIGLIVTNGTAIRAMNDIYRSIATLTIGIIPMLGIIAFAILILAYFLAKRTLFGRYVYAIGGGERVAGLCGVPVARYKIYAFILAGALSGMAGALTSARLGAATNIQGDGMALDAIAAVVMGGTSLSGGKGGPLNTLVGVLVIILLSNGLNMIGVQPYTQTLIKGLVVILAVAMNSDRSSRAVVK